MINFTNIGNLTNNNLKGKALLGERTITNNNNNFD